MKEITGLLKVLSDESRLRALNLILERECCVCEVMQAMEVSQSKASRMLRMLYDVGLLKLRREGRWVLYSIDNNQVQGHVASILAGISHFLKDNPVISGDLKRLARAERLGPTCVVKGYGKRLAGSIWPLQSTN